MAVPQLQDVTNYLNQLKIRLNKAMINNVTMYRKRLDNVTSKYIFTNPISIYQTKEMVFDNLVDRLKHSLESLANVKEKQLLLIKSSYVFKNPDLLLDKKRNKYMNLISKLEPLSPLLTLKRGFAITKKDDKVISSIKDVNTKDRLSVELQDGSINVEVL